MTDKEIKKNEVSLISKDKVSMNILTNLNESKKDNKDDEVENKSGIVSKLSDIIKKYRIVTKVNQDIFISDCPFCNEINCLCSSDIAHFYICLRCKEQGNKVDFVKKIENISEEKAKKGLYKNDELASAPISDILKYKKNK